MSSRTSSFWSSSRKDSTTTRHLSKLKSWFTKPRLPAPASSQIQSKLLSTLPIEIRYQIYGYVLNSYGKFQHVHLVNGKLAHMRCTVPTSHSYFQDFQARYKNICEKETWNDDYRKSTRNGWEVLPLLLSCKKIYVEFIDLLYSSATFELTIHVASRFIATVPSSHLALTNLRLSFGFWNPMYLPDLDIENTFLKESKEEEARWETFWRAFSRVKIRNLVLEIIDAGYRVSEQRLLEPLKGVRADAFEVVLPWPTGLEDSWDFRDAEFTVMRPPEGVDLMMGIDVEQGQPERGYQRPNWKGVWGRLWRRG